MSNEKQLVIPWQEVAKAIGWWIRCHYDKEFPFRDGDQMSMTHNEVGLVIERIPKQSGG